VLRGGAPDRKRPECRIAHESDLRAFFQLDYEFRGGASVHCERDSDEFLVDGVVLQQFLRGPRILARNQSAPSVRAAREAYIFEVPIGVATRYRQPAAESP